MPLLQTEKAIRNRARRARFRAQGLCACGQRPTIPGHSQCRKCYDMVFAWRDRIRREVLAAYGNKCQCPGGCDVSQSEFLSLDHINNDGHEHRKALFMGKKAGDAIRAYVDVKKRGFPKDQYRLLCHNCNQARQFYGKCPHEVSWEHAEKSEQFQLFEPARPVLNKRIRHHPKEKTALIDTSLSPVGINGQNA